MTAVAIFGISGRTGTALTSAAQARSWTVRSFGRISSIAPTGAAVIRGGFDDAARVEAVVEGTDAVCCVFGPRPPYTDVFCARATAAVVAAMRAMERVRLLCVTGAMIGSLACRSRPMEWMAAWFRWRRAAGAQDREEQEAVVMQSGLDWTIIKPPRLTDAPPTARMTAGVDQPVGLLSSISRTDLAEFMLDEIAVPRFSRQRVVVVGARA